MKSKIIKYKWYILTIFIFIISSTIFDYYIYNKKIQFRTEFKEKSLNGHIVYLTKGGRCRSEFQLNTEKKRDELYLERDRVGVNDTAFNLYQIAEIGDSIFKESNSACLKLIKKNGTQIWFELKEY